MRTLTDPTCERARCLTSLRLDGETTELEEAFLVSHLEACPGCRAHADAVSASTALIRETSPVDAPVFAPFARRPRRAGLRHVQVAAAALFVLGAGLTGLAGVPRADQSTESPSTRPAYLDSATYEQGLIRQLNARPADRWPGLKVLAS